MVATTARLKMLMNRLNILLTDSWHWGKSDKIIKYHRIVFVFYAFVILHAMFLHYGYDFESIEALTESTIRSFVFMALYIGFALNFRKAEFVARFAAIIYMITFLFIVIISVFFERGNLIIDNLPELSKRGILNVFIMFVLVYIIKLSLFLYQRKLRKEGGK